MISLFTEIPMLENDQFWLVWLGDREFVLIDDRPQGASKDHPFQADTLARFIFRGSVQYAFMCGRVCVESTEEPLTVFFVIRNPDCGDAHVTDIRRYMTGHYQDAIRNFQELTLTEKATLFGL